MSEPRFRTIPAGLVRVAAFVGFVTAIAGMIVSSIDDADGRAVGFGLVGAASALTLVAVTAVGGFTTRPPVAEPVADADAPAAVDDLASDLEATIGAMVASGAEESTVRELVRRSVELGRRLARSHDS